RAVLSSGIEDITIDEQRFIVLDGPAADPWIARHPALAPFARYNGSISAHRESVFRLEGTRPINGPDTRTARWNDFGSEWDPGFLGDLPGRGVMTGAS